MVLTFGQLAQNIKDFFQLTFTPHIGMGRKVSPVYVVNPVPKYMPDAVLSQSNPVSGQKYVVLDTSANCRIISISVDVTWTVQPTPLEVHVTVDGVEWSASKTNPVSTTVYYVSNPEWSAAWTLGSALAGARAFLFSGRSVKIEVETTGGTTSQLNARVKYGQW